MFHLQILYVVTCYSVAVPIVSLAAVANMTVATGSYMFAPIQSAFGAAVPVFHT